MVDVASFKNHSFDFNELEPWTQFRICMENDKLTTISAVLRPGGCEIKRSYNYQTENREHDSNAFFNLTFVLVFWIQFLI